MLDDLYSNIGGKIKNLAKWIFTIEAIGAIIAGFMLMIADESLLPYGVLTLICGPVIAFVGSWILYAFGQLVEDVHNMQNKEATSSKKTKPNVSPKPLGNGYLCPVCKMTMDSMAPCERCGYKPPLSES